MTKIPVLLAMVGMRNLAVLGVLLFGAACESYDLRMQSELRPTGEPDRFVWRTIADAVYPLESPTAEAARVRQLGEIMKLNSACAGGYQVIDRQATQVNKPGLLGVIYDVFYTIQC